jgi:hypothetical protein
MSTKKMPRVVPVGPTASTFQWHVGEGQPWPDAPRARVSEAHCRGSHRALERGHLLRDPIWFTPGGDSLTAVDAISAPAPDDGGASPPLPSDPFCVCLSHRDARAPLHCCARLLPRRLPRLPPPTRHPKLPPRRWEIMVCKRIPWRLPLLPEAHRRCNKYILLISFYVSPAYEGTFWISLTCFVWLQWGVSSDEGAVWPVANPAVTCADVSEAGFDSSFITNPFLFIQVLTLSPTERRPKTEIESSWALRLGRYKIANSNGLLILGISATATAFHPAALPRPAPAAPSPAAPPLTPPPPALTAPPRLLCPRLLRPRLCHLQPRSLCPGCSASDPGPPALPSWSSSSSHEKTWHGWEWVLVLVLHFWVARQPRPRMGVEYRSSVGEIFPCYSCQHFRI